MKSCGTPGQHADTDFLKYTFVYKKPHWPIEILQKTSHKPYVGFN